MDNGTKETLHNVLFGVPSAYTFALRGGGGGGVHPDFFVKIDFEIYSSCPTN